MSKGTILYLGGFELPDKNAAAHRVLSIGKSLRDSGYTVVYLDVDKTLPPDADVLATKRDVQGFACYSRPYPCSSRQWLSYLANIMSFRQVFDSHPDVKGVICYNYQAMSLQRLLSFCKGHGIKVIADCTEWYSVRGTPLPYLVVRGLDTWYGMRLLHKRLDGLIVISAYLADYYKAHPHVLQVPPTVDRMEEKWRQSRQPVPQALNLVYAGSPDGKDRLDCLIDVLSRSVEPYHLDIIGITKEHYLGQFPAHRAMIDHAADAICFHGRLGHRETLSFVQSADYSCFFRADNRLTRAGFPTKFVESVSCGTPVFTNRSSNLMDYMKTGDYGVCLETLSPSAVERGLSDCLARCGRPMPEAAAASFDYRNYTGRIQAFIEGVLQT